MVVAKHIVFISVIYSFVLLEANYSQNVLHKTQEKCAIMMNLKKASKRVKKLEN